MPQSYSSMKHEQILQLCVEGSQPARREALIRNIMSVDSIEYDQATIQVIQLAQINRSYMQLEYSPYHLGMGGALLSGAISFPLVFDKRSVMWFNDVFVTAEIPPPEDLETFWEIGSWSWGWMEPVIGQASFVLLLLQFARSQAMKLGLKPYGDYMLHVRSKRLVEAYPQYNPMFLNWFAESEALYVSNYLLVNAQNIESIKVQQETCKTSKRISAIERSTTELKQLLLAAYRDRTNDHSKLAT
eukprot:scaffold1174_cov281-Chaetoceros_neogracile.AAC.13